MSLDIIFNVLTQWKLNEEELMLIYLTFLAQDEQNHKEYLERWLQYCQGQDRLKRIFESLKVKGIIDKNYNPETYNPDDIEFNPNFLKKYFRITQSLGTELFNKYPKYITIDGKLFALRNIQKGFGTMDSFCDYYAREINHSKQEHEKIMELLQWGIDNDRIKFGLSSFVVDHKWEDLEAMRNNNFDSVITDTFNTYELV